MRIFIDADSCPREIRPIIIRAAEKYRVPADFVANRAIEEIVKNSADSTAVMRLVPAEEGSADHYILSHAESSDLVITRDIPLAAELLKADVTVINDRGDRFYRESIRERLSMRDTMKKLRQNGLLRQKGRKFGMREKKSFADTFNREFMRILQKEQTLS